MKSYLLSAERRHIYATGQWIEKTTTLYDPHYVERSSDPGTYLAAAEYVSRLPSDDKHARSMLGIAWLCDVHDVFTSKGSVTTLTLGDEERKTFPELADMRQVELRDMGGYYLVRRVA